MIAGFAMDEIGLAAQTMFAELTQQALDAEFDDSYDERGNFIRKRIDGPLYWYYQRKSEGKLTQKYVGPVKDDAINQRVRHFNELKSDFSKRRRMVRALLATGLLSPDPITGDVIEALWKAGFFRLRGVLVGTAAFQCYSGILGVRMASSSLMTQDLDAAQFYDISHMVSDSIPPILDVLKQVDSSFAPVPNTFYPGQVTRFRARDVGYAVEFLTPNRGSDRNVGKPAVMPPLGGASATPLRFLDHLIYEPIRSVVLHKGGIPVTVPSPQRFAVHKLIVAAQRKQNPAKADKDIMQAEQLIRASLSKRSLSLFEAWSDAWDRGPSWRASLKQGVSMMRQEIQTDFLFSMETHGWSERGPAALRKRKKAPARKTAKRKVLGKKR